MKSPIRIMATLVLASAASASLASAQTASPKYCLTVSDTVAFLNHADREQAYLRLEADAQRLKSEKCAERAKIIGGHMLDLVQASMTQDDRVTCKASADPDINASIVTIARITYGLRTQSACSAAE